MVSANVEKRIFDVLVLHIPCVDEQELNALAKIIVSAVRPAIEGDVGRSYETKLNKAITQIESAVKAFEIAKSALVNLDELAREALSRQLKGLLDADDFAPIGTARAWTEMGYAGYIEQFEANLSEFAQNLSVTHEALLENAVPRVRGAPPKDGPRAVALQLVAIYEEYVGPVAHPSWNHYTSETYGAAYSFLKSIFEAADIKASAEDMLKNAIQNNAKS